MENSKDIEQGNKLIAEFIMPLNNRPPNCILLPTQRRVVNYE